MKQLLKIASLLTLLMPFYTNAQDLTFVKKYAGTYNLLANGQTAKATSDKYMLNADGKGVWTMFTTANLDGTGAKKAVNTKGTWFATEGVIHLQFSMGEAKGGEMISEYHLTDGVFKAEGVFLKKVGTKAKK